MVGITWLQLSDWHQGSEAYARHQESEVFDRTLLSQRLKEDILNRTSISTDLAKVDFFVFSGDVAFSGQDAEYQAAIEQLFTPVLAATGLGKDKLFIVPGNHDLDRMKFRWLPGELTHPFNSDAEVKVWLNDSNREYILKLFAAYDQFIKTYTGQKNPTYASVSYLDIDGKKIALLGLNSALICGRNKIKTNGKEEVHDYGYLVVGEPQLFDGLNHIGDADVSIAVLHHSFEWLMPFDRFRTKEQLGENFHFILCGHEHFPEVNMIQGTAGHCLMIPAGAGFDKRVPDNPIYTNAYNFVHLDFDTGQVTVYLRRWNYRKSKFDKDTNIYPDGQKSFDLPKLPSHPSPKFALPISATISDASMTPSLINEQEQSTALESSQEQKQFAFNEAAHTQKSISHIDSSQQEEVALVLLTPSSTAVIPVEPSFEQFFTLAHRHIMAAMNSVQIAYFPFKKKGNIKSVRCLEAINALNEMNRYLQDLHNLLIKTSPFPTAIIKNHQRYIRNTDRISKQREDLIDAIKSFRSAKYKNSPEQLSLIRKDIMDKFEQLIQALDHLDTFIKA